MILTTNRETHSRDVALQRLYKFLPLYYLILVKPLNLTEYCLIWYKHALIPFFDKPP